MSLLLFYAEKGFFCGKVIFFCGKGEVDETSKLRSCVCLSLQVYGCNSAFLIICSTVDGIRGWERELKSLGKGSDTETVLSEQKMCIFINKANQPKKETLTKDAGRKLTTTDHTTNSKHHHSNTSLHREGSNTTRVTHYQEPPCLSLLHHSLQSRTSPSLFIHPRPTSKVAAAAGRRRGQSPGWRKQRDNRHTHTDPQT